MLIQPLRSKSAQALVELTFMLPVLLALMFGAFYIGIAAEKRLNTQLSVYYASRAHTMQSGKGPSDDDAKRDITEAYFGPKDQVSISYSKTGSNVMSYLIYLLDVVSPLEAAVSVQTTVSCRTPLPQNKIVQTVLGAADDGGYLTVESSAYTIGPAF